MAIVAAAAQAHLHPSPPPPPPLARRTTAWLACADAAWAAVTCLLLASLWVFVWALAAEEIGWLTCGERCDVVTSAFKVASVAWIALLLVLPFSLLGARMMAAAQSATVVPVPVPLAATTTDAEAAQEPALTLKTCHAALRRALRDPVVQWFLATIACTLLMLTAVLIVGDNPVMGSRRTITCSVIYHLGAVGMNMVNCFVLCPLTTLRVWRSWSKARHALL